MNGKKIVIQCEKQQSNFLSQTRTSKLLTKSKYSVTCMGMCECVCMLKVITESFFRYGGGFPDIVHQEGACVERDGVSNRC